MIGAAGLTFAIALGASDSRTPAQCSAPTCGQGAEPVGEHRARRTISIMSPATEMGQGSMTSLPLILAEELDADWTKVRIVPAPPIEAIYGNPGFGGMMYTAGSNAVTSYSSRCASSARRCAACCSTTPPRSWACRSRS